MENVQEYGLTLGKGEELLYPYRGMYTKSRKHYKNDPKGVRFEEKNGAALSLHTRLLACAPGARRRGNRRRTGKIWIDAQVARERKNSQRVD